ncbi:MAG: hypothetical protein E7Z86_06520 [Methanosphaera stadtmanae]|nr:hypothetical protein [Methanosphaera stadtmanae]
MPKIHYIDATKINTNLTKGKVTFKVDGKTLKDANGKVIYAKVVNGTATIEDYMVPDTWNKHSTIQAVYSGSSELAKISSEKTELTIQTPEITITTSDTTATNCTFFNYFMRTTLRTLWINILKSIIFI